MNIRQVIWEGVNQKDVPLSKSIVQLKYDGSQVHIHIAKGKIYGVTSKRISKKTEMLNDKTKKFRNIKNSLFSTIDKETIFVCEVVAEHLKKDFERGKIFLLNGQKATWNKRCGYVSSILNSSNILVDNLAFVCFDVLMYEGKDVSELSYEKKLKIIKKHFFNAGIFGEHIYAGSFFYPTDISEHYIEETPKEILQMVTEKGYEGVVVKNKNNNDCYKMKREIEADCIILGFNEGTNKYAKNGWIGSIVVGVLVNEISDFLDTKKENKKANYIEKKDVEYLLKKGFVVEVGNISGFDESLRAEISANKDKYIGKVIHCEAMEWTGKKMRHPRIGVKGIRTDKLVKRCTLYQLGEVK